MKKYTYILAFMLSLFIFVSCEKDEDKAILLSNPVASNLNALPTFNNFNLDNTGSELEFSWSAADFGFDASITYTLQVDTATKDFSNPIEVMTGQNLSGTITVGDFNKALTDAGYEEYDVTQSFQCRVIATVSSEVDPVVSNIIDFSVAPFATSFPPIYMCGAATGGWDWTLGVEMRSSAPKVYQTIAYFINGETFRFFAQPDWGPTSYNYPWFAGGNVSSDFEDAMDGDNNFRFLGATGYYDITCDLKTKSVSITAVDEPVMFMTGAAIGGWNWTTDYVQMTWTSNGMFEATTEFINGEAFRFFAQADWGPTSYNYPYFSGGEVDALFEDALDGDNNFRFIGTTGNYRVRLNMLDNIVSMTAMK